MPEPDLNPDLTAVADALARLSPAPPALDRDRLFFEAGRQAVRPRPWVWPLSTGLCAALTFGIGLRLAPAPATVAALPVIEIRVPVPESPAPAALAVAERPIGDALRLRELKLLWSAEALPTTPVSTADEPIEALLGLKPGSLTDAQLHRVKIALSRGDI